MGYVGIEIHGETIFRLVFFFFFTRKRERGGCCARFAVFFSFPPRKPRIKYFRRYTQQRNCVQYRTG